MSDTLGNVIFCYAGSIAMRYDVMVLLKTMLISVFPNDEGIHRYCPIIHSYVAI